MVEFSFQLSTNVSSLVSSFSDRLEAFANFLATDNLYGHDFFPSAEP